ncbi:hypothetical protein CMV_026887 [Castanea mollissima]|uniref:LysM domain-containing protein n=1 Tax=Castanea mollissima TaxID=60419 RepID=A0A8J4QGB1_9ROSI|nr:hypothetical protein CMV_026887 [Castanea mollissima]
MKKYNLYYICSVLLLVLLLKQHPSKAQQAFSNYGNSDCDEDIDIANGYRCNGETSCQSYLTFRFNASYYSAATIGSLLGVDASVIAEINDITKFQPIPTEPKNRIPIIIPVSCSCSGQYYQQRSYYRVQSESETYFTIAKIYQGLTTCRAMMHQNPYKDKTLRMGVDVIIPLRCACPTPNQTASGFKYLLTYTIINGDNLSAIAGSFGADIQSILDANKGINENSIPDFATLLVPLKRPINNVIVNLDADNSKNKWANRWWIWLIIVTVGGIIIALLCFFYHSKWKKQKAEEERKKKQNILVMELGEENTNRVVGTYGYMSLEYAMNGVVSIKIDVFSFGVLLLEIISGKKNNSRYHSEYPLNLIGYAWQLWNEGKGLELTDLAILDESCIPSEVLRCIHVGLLCVQDQATDRPTMVDVVSFLANETIQLSTPKQPAFFINTITKELDALENKSKNYSINNVTISKLDAR